MACALAHAGHFFPDCRQLGLPRNSCMATGMARRPLGLPLLSQRAGLLLDRRVRVSRKSACQLSNVSRDVYSPPARWSSGPGGNTCVVAAGYARSALGTYAAVRVACREYADSILRY